MTRKEIINIMQNYYKTEEDLMVNYYDIKNFLYSHNIKLKEIKIFTYDHDREGVAVFHIWLYDGFDLEW